MKRRIYIAILLLLGALVLNGCEEKPDHGEIPDGPPADERIDLQAPVEIQAIDITTDGLLIRTDQPEYAGDLLPLSVIERFWRPVRIKTSGTDMITFSLDDDTQVDLVSGTAVYYLNGTEMEATGPSFETDDEEYVHASVLAELLDAEKTEEGWLLPAAAEGSGELENIADYRGQLGFLSLINKGHGMDKDALGHDLINLNETYPQFSYLKSDMEFNQTAALALNRMVTDLTLVPDMEQLFIVSTYRSYDYQASIHQRKIKQYMDNYGYDEETAAAEAARIVAIPGTSEHQSGLAVDFTGKTLVDQGLYLEQAFLDTPSGAWLEEHAPEYGFILRYPEGTEEKTEIMQEAWHYRFVGLPHSRFITENLMVLEDYMELLKKTRKQGMWFEDPVLVTYLDEDWAGLVRVDTGLTDVSDSNNGGLIVTIHGW